MKKSLILFMYGESENQLSLEVTHFSLSNEVILSINSLFRAEALPTAFGKVKRGEIDELPKPIHFKVNGGGQFFLEFEIFEGTWAISLIHPSDGEMYSCVLTDNELTSIKGCFYG